MSSVMEEWLDYRAMRKISISLWAAVRSVSTVSFGNLVRSALGNAENVVFG